MPPIILSPEKKLTILLEKIGKFITNDKRKNKIYRSWISGDRWFYNLHETDNIDIYRTYNTFFYPINPDTWKFKVTRRIVVGMEEHVECLIDMEFLGEEKKVLREVMKLNKYKKIIDSVENMFRTRMKQNPHYISIQHEMALNGELKNSEEYLNTYYGEEKKEQHRIWKEKHNKWIEEHPIEALEQLSRRKKKLISIGVNTPEDFGIYNLPENYIIPNFEKDRLQKIRDTQTKRENENRIKLEEELKRKAEEAREKIRKGDVDMSESEFKPTDEDIHYKGEIVGKQKKINKRIERKNHDRQDH